MSRVVAIACRAMGVRCIQALAEKFPATIARVITFDESQEKGIAGYEALDQVCERHRIPLFKVRDINSTDAINLVEEVSPDLVLQVAWTQIFGSRLLSLPRFGSVGFHSSLLPSYRGGSPVNWGIINGETEWGISMFFMNEGVDTGDLIDQMTFEISAHDTCRTVYEKATECAVTMLQKHWTALLKGVAGPIPLPERPMTVCKRRKPSDGVIDWSKTAKEIYDWVRALTRPYPGAFSFHKGRKLFIWSCKWIETFLADGLQPGAVIGPVSGTDAEGDGGVAIAAKNGILVLTDVEFEDDVRLCGKAIAGRIKTHDIVG